MGPLLDTLLSADFVPHGYCMRWQSDVIGLHVLSDVGIALAYVSISILLLLFLRRRRDIQFSWLLAAFALFILTCGATHVMDVVTLWKPVYRLAGIVKALTSLISLGTAISLARIWPTLLRVPTTAQLETANCALDAEVRQRRAAEATLARLNSELRLQATALMAANDAAMEVRTRLQCVLDSANEVAIITTDNSGVLQLFNRGAEHLLLYSANDVVGQHTPAVFLPPREICRRQEEALRRTGQNVAVKDLFNTCNLPNHPYWTETTYQRRDGTELQASLCVAPLLDSNARREGTVAIAIDVSVQRKLTEQLQKLNHELQVQSQQATEANRKLMISNGELQSFASAAAHDLQEPLRKVQVFGDRLQTVLLEANLDHEAQDYLNRMLNATSRMQYLIRDLLSFSQVTSRAHVFEKVDLSRVAREVLADLEVQIAETGALMDVGDLPIVEADALQMRQLLQNLIGNALKFRTPGQTPIVRIHGEIAPQDGACRLVVSDNGIGFDEKYLDRIFIVFQRLHCRSEYGGTGVGLAICRKIVHRHGGEITATSVPNKGASFNIMLPRHAPVDSEPVVLFRGTTMNSVEDEAEHSSSVIASEMVTYEPAR